MAGQNYEALKNKQGELIRKALQGSVFGASVDAAVPSALTDVADSLLLTTLLPTTGSPEMPWDDFGWLSNDGAQFSRDVSTSDVTSWGSVTPTRSDVVTDTSTLTIVCQETKLMTIGLATGSTIAAGDLVAGSGELIITKPARPSSKAYRVLSLAVDQGDAGEIYIGRLLPRAKVTGFSEQSFGGGDDPISWGVTFTGEEDSTLGFSERWFFGGPGWKALAEKMGFTAVV